MPGVQVSQEGVSGGGLLFWSAQPDQLSLLCVLLVGAPAACRRCTLTSSIRCAREPHAPALGTACLHPLGWNQIARTTDKGAVSSPWLCQPVPLTSETRTCIGDPWKGAGSSDSELPTPQNSSAPDKAPRARTAKTGEQSHKRGTCWGIWPKQIPRCSLSTARSAEADFLLLTQHYPSGSLTLRFRFTSAIPLEVRFRSAPLQFPAPGAAYLQQCNFFALERPLSRQAAGRGLCGWCREAHLLPRTATPMAAQGMRRILMSLMMVVGGSAARGGQEERREQEEKGEQEERAPEAGGAGGCAATTRVLAVVVRDKSRVVVAVPCPPPLASSLPAPPLPAPFSLPAPALCRTPHHHQEAQEYHRHPWAAIAVAVLGSK